MQQNLAEQNMTIRSASGSDLPAILALLDENHLPQAGLAEHVETTLIACNDQQIIGSAGLEIYGNFALLRSVSISPSLQKQGLGQQLTQAALDLAQQRNIRQVFLLTETAIDYFPRFGFESIARAEVPAEVQQSVEFVSACPDSAVAMRLKLSS